MRNESNHIICESIEDLKCLVERHKQWRHAMRDLHAQRREGKKVQKDHRGIKEDYRKSKIS